MEGKRKEKGNKLVSTFKTHTYYSYIYILSYYNIINTPVKLSFSGVYIFNFQLGQENLAIEFYTRIIVKKKSISKLGNQPNMNLVNLTRIKREKEEYIQEEFILSVKH